MTERFSISHDRREESPEAKARWFRGLSLAERMELLCELTELALSRNPDLAKKLDDTPSSGRVQVISRP